MQRMLHIPCPGCGITHALLALSLADYGASIKANPAGLPLAVGFCFQLIARPVAIVYAGCRPMVADLSHRITATVVTLLFVVWFVRLTLIIRGTNG
jgi:hypothetical protein